MFRPACPLARYCSDECRLAACRWSRWKAARRYRATEAGKKVRREQARRYRQRVREREQNALEAESAAGNGGSGGGGSRRATAVQAAAVQGGGGEGHQSDTDSEKTGCSRPGCYETFASESRSPLKKFCSGLCRQALRRVLRREACWLRSLHTAARKEPAWWPRGPDPPGR